MKEELTKAVAHQWPGLQDIDKNVRTYMLSHTWHSAGTTHAQLYVYCVLHYREKKIIGHFERSRIFQVLVLWHEAKVCQSQHDLVHGPFRDTSIS